MGSSCSKGETTECSDRLLDSETETQQCFKETCLVDKFTVKLDCFSITTNRLSIKTSSLTKGCKSAVVTRIKLEANELKMPRVTKTNSVLHMPVISLSEMDVQLQHEVLGDSASHQDSKYLAPKEADNNVQVQQKVHKNVNLTADELAQINKTLEEALNRYKKRSSKGKDAASAVAQGRTSRTSQQSRDTRASPRFEPPYSGLSYIDDSTDSSKESPKEKHREKLSKFRRKDTPSHTLMVERDSKWSSKYKRFKQHSEGNLLEEQSESEASDNDYDGDGLGKVHLSETVRESLDISHGKIYKRRDCLNTESQLDEDIPKRLSRSFNNLQELKDDPPEIMASSPHSLKRETRGKRKKQSIGSRLSKFSYPEVVLPAQRTQIGAGAYPSITDQEYDHDADDEGENANNVIGKRKDKQKNGDSADKETVVKGFDKQQDLAEKEESLGEINDNKTAAVKSTDGELAVDNTDDTDDCANRINMCTVTEGTGLDNVESQQERKSDYPASNDEGRTNMVSLEAQYLAGKLNESTGRLDESTGRLDESTGRLNESTGRLDESTGRLNESTGRLDESTGRLDEIGKEEDCRPKRSSTMSYSTRPKIFRTVKQRKILSLEEKRDSPQESVPDDRPVPTSAFMEKKE